MPTQAGEAAPESNEVLKCGFCRTFLEAAEYIRAFHKEREEGASKGTKFPDHRQWYLTSAEIYNDCLAHRDFYESLEDTGHARDSSAVTFLFGGISGLTLQGPERSDGLAKYTNPLLINDLCQKPIIRLGRALDHFIDPALIIKWRNDCEKYHGTTCQDKVTRLRQPPSCLIDTKEMCLVGAAYDMEYVALSYVWGRTPMLKTTRANINMLRQQNSLEQLVDQLPATILDSIRLVPLLEERYLWIDSLCIIQDDKDSVHQQIDQMAAIYDNATLVIVAADGQDAEAGLHGLPHSSQTRLPRPILQLTPKTRFTAPLPPPQSSLPWMSRGWTVQENIFSRRKVVFFGNTVRWMCRHSTYREDIEDLPAGGRRGALISKSFDLEDINSRELSLGPPNLHLLCDLIVIYNQRSLTFEEDVMAAISSTFEVMQQAFPRGFIYGLPVSFFDAFLVWRGKGHGLRRRKASRPDAECPPSWSWAGWKGVLDPGAWNVPPGIFGGCLDTPPVIPTLTWCTRETKGSPERVIPFQNDAYHYKVRFMGKESDLPQGWKYKLDYGGGKLLSWYYKHESCPGVRFRHPIPIGEPGGKANSHATSYGRYLCARTHQARLSARKINRDEIPQSLIWALGVPDVANPRFDEGLALLENEQGGPAGVLFPDSDHDFARIRTAGSWHISIEVVQISQEFGPGDNWLWTFYNVLWVEWEDGVACRKGLGKVKKSAWEELEKKEISLVLG